MKYWEYQTAALRHLNTCKYIVNKVKNDTLPNEIKRQYYYNIYYLAGHAIEAIVTYGIYDYIGYSNNEEVENLRENHPKARMYKVVFKGGNNQYYKIVHHNFQENIDFFDYHNINNINTIPFIGHIPSDRQLQKMFDNWDAAARYTTLININTRHKLKELNLQSISSDYFEKFVTITEQIYTGIRTHITQN